MTDDDSIKALLEKLCSLQEQQLAKLSEALERAAAARERVEKIGDSLKGFAAKLEEAQKMQAKRAVGYQIGAWIRTAFLGMMLFVIAIAIIVAHYLK
jgi:uncharacterized coiled-coil protein SlyX